MLIGLVVFVVLAVMAFGALGFVVLGKVGNDQKKAEENAPTALDALFDGSEKVTFSGHMRSMKYETVIGGGESRGYALAHQAGDPKGAFTLMFERASSAA